MILGKDYGSTWYTPGDQILLLELARNHLIEIGFLLAREEERLLLSAETPEVAPVIPAAGIHALCSSFSPGTGWSM